MIIKISVISVPSSVFTISKMKILLLLSFFNFFSQNQWEEFVDLNGRFKISSPGILEEKLDTVQTDLGPLVYHTFFYQAKEKGSDKQVYMVSYCDYPKGIIFADSLDLADEFFQNTMDAAAESVEGEIRYQSDIQLDGHPGKLWRIDYMDGNAVIKTKAFLVNNRYYAVQTISFYEKNINPSVDRFFDSFRLL